MDWRRLAATVVSAVIVLAAAKGAAAQRYLLRPGSGRTFEHELETDREAFTPSTTTVGQNVWLAEWSYSYIDNRETPDTHSYPELLIRYGITERIELRFGWNYEIGGGGNVVSAIESSEGLGGPFVTAESKVLYGAKVVVSEQRGWIPRSCVILEGFTPTSGDEPASQPVATYAFGWLLENEWRFDTALRYAQGNELTDTYNKWAPSTVIRIPLSPRFQVHAGYFGVFTEGRDLERSRAFLSPGMHYNFDPNLELGLRVGWGITPDAAKFFVNTGLGWRF